jgi:hypothetical protein
MKTIKYVLFIGLICLFSSCESYTFLNYEDPVKQVYVQSDYYDYITGTSVVYINHKPYYQYYNHKHKYWYRKPVPYHNQGHIKHKPHHRPSYSRPSPKPIYDKPHHKPRVNPVPNNNRRTYQNNMQYRRR